MHGTMNICSGTSQVFLDVVESVNLLVNSNGTVVRSEVVGALKMRTFLSGMPECKLGLNDKARPVQTLLDQPVYRMCQLLAAHDRPNEACFSVTRYTVFRNCTLASAVGRCMA
jgi:hypothetical protein